jgi:RimJ/RimL family protein N-acetyltransferase
MSRLESVVLEGSLVRLEPLGHQHRDGLWRVASGDRSTFTYTWVPETYEELGDYIDEALGEFAIGEGLPFAQVRVRDELIVGTTRFKELLPWEWPPNSPEQRESPDASEIGRTWLDPAVQGTGINAEAKLLLLTHAFETLNLRRVSLQTDERNVASQRAIEALGMRNDGTLRAHRVCADGTVRDSRFYSLLTTEWPATKVALKARVSRYIAQHSGS